MANFVDQAALLARECDVVSLDAALDGLAHGDDHPKVVVTFDDGFADLHDVVWPILANYDLPFTVYLATGFWEAPCSGRGRRRPARRRWR